MIIGGLLIERNQLKGLEQLIEEGVLIWEMCPGSLYIDGNIINTIQENYDKELMQSVN